MNCENLEFIASLAKLQTYTKKNRPANNVNISVNHFNIQKIKSVQNMFTSP